MTACPLHVRSTPNSRRGQTGFGLPKKGQKPLLPLLGWPYEIQRYPMQPRYSAAAVQSPANAQVARTRRYLSDSL